MSSRREPLTCSEVVLKRARDPERPQNDAILRRAPHDASECCAHPSRRNAKRRLAGKGKVGTVRAGERRLRPGLTSVLTKLCVGVIVPVRTRGLVSLRERTLAVTHSIGDVESRHGRHPQRCSAGFFGACSGPPLEVERERTRHHVRNTTPGHGRRKVVRPRSPRHRRDARHRRCDLP
jgi:hypothetical protein